MTRGTASRSGSRRHPDRLSRTALFVAVGPDSRTTCSESRPALTASSSRVAASADRIVQSGAVWASCSDMAGAMSGAPMATRGMSRPGIGPAGAQPRGQRRQIGHRCALAEIFVADRQGLKRNAPEELVRNDEHPRGVRQTFECLRRQGVKHWRDRLIARSRRPSRSPAAACARPPRRARAGRSCEVRATATTLPVVDPRRQADQCILVDDEIEQHLAGAEDLCQVGDGARREHPAPAGQVRQPGE